MLGQRYFSLARGRTVGLLLLIPVASAIEVAVSTLLQLITDTATGTSNLAYGVLVSVVVGYIVIDAVTFFASAYLEQVTLNHIVSVVRNRLMAGLLRQPTGVGRDTQQVTTAYRNDFTNTLGILRNDYLQGTLSAYRQLCQFVIALGLSLMIKPILSLAIILLCVPSLCLPLFRQATLKANKQRVLQESQGYTRRLQDATQGLRTVQLFNVQGLLRTLFQQQNARLLHAQNRDQLTRKEVGGASQLMDNVLYLGTWVVGIYFVMNKTITLGQLVAFSQLMIFISEPIQSASGLLGDVVGGREAAEQLDHQMTSQPEPTGKETLAPLDTIQYDHVTVDLAGQPVLKNVTTTFATNQRYVIVGKSGSDKSTLINLPLSGDLPWTGNLTLNDVTVTDYDLASVHRRLGLLEQHSYLFDASLADNLTLFNAPEDPGRLMTVLRQVGLTAYATPAGLATRVSEQGTVLSGGERRRLALGRLLLRPSDFTFLDEPLTGLDPRTARDIVTTITHELTGGWAVVTHQYDAELFAAADQVLVLDAGQLVAQGTSTDETVVEWLGRLNLIVDD